MQMRLAKYYLGRLRAANTIYRRGAASSIESTTLLGQEWAQIAQWHAWAAAQSSRNPEAARLCASYAQDGADILNTRQTPHERVAWLEAGLAAARAIGDARATAACLLGLAWAIYRTELERAEEVARQALTHSRRIRDSLLIGESLHLLGEMAMRRAALVEAERLFLQSVALLQPIEAQAALANVYFSLSELAYWQGLPDRAHAYALQCYQIQQTLGLNQSINNNLTWLGLMTIEAGDFAGGEQYVRQSEELCRAVGAQSTLAHTLSTLCELMIVRKDAAQARAYAQEALKIAEDIGEAWLIPFLLVHSGAIHALTGDYEAAQRDTSQALKLVLASGNRSAQIYALMHLAEIQVANGALEAASDSLCESIRAALQANNNRDIVYGVFVALKLWHRRGDALRAAEWAELLLNSRGVDYGLRRDLRSICDELLGLLGADAFAAAAEHAKTLDLQTVAEQIMSTLVEARHTLPE
jgi:tetratricopeptide (TPR) repeat protein